MLRILSMVVLLAGCAGNTANGEPNTPKPEPAERVEEPADQPVEAPADGEDGEKAEAPTPASLYAECEQRVERPQEAGECTSDDDCVKAGCGSEVCTTKEAAAEVMTTCEDRLCFKVLDTCGCNDGVCSWSLKDEVPEMKQLQPLPNKLPPTKLP